MNELPAVPHRLFVEHDIKVGTYEIDFAGHVSNIAYLRWLEDMRLMLFDKYFPLQGFMEQGKTPVLASTEIKYKRPIKLFDQPHGIMWVSAMGKASMTIDAEFFVDQNLTTAAKHVGVFVELASGKPVRVPAICLDLFNGGGLNRSGA